MFNNLYKKIITVIIAINVALSATLIPALAFAKNNDENWGLSFWAKQNHGQKVSSQAKLKNELKFNKENHFGLKEFLSADILSTISSESLQIFKQEMKDAKSNKKETNKNARIQFKTDIKAADTQDEKISAVKTYLTSLLNAFKTFATAKESALTKFINSL